jgi:hypothetical protein
MKTIPFFFILMVIVLFSGCTAPASLRAANTVSASDPSAMTLHVSDLPDGYVISNTQVNMDPALFKKITTVKSGYQIMFRNGTTADNSTLITQVILIVPDDQLGQIVPNYLSALKEEGNTYDQLPDPRLGDTSSAFQIQDPYSRKFYIIIFEKGDVAVFLQMTRYHPDYEVLKSVAKKAETRIG